VHYPFPNPRECFREIGETGEFIFIAQLAPTLVVTVLFSSARIAASCLKMPVWGGADPNVSPSRRNRQAFNSKDALFVANSLSFYVKVLEVVAVRFPTIAGSIIANVV
jgi:hypothetical protein